MTSFPVVIAVCVFVCCGDVSASFGTSFAVSFPPTRSNTETGYCKMYIHTDSDTIVPNALTISTTDSSSTWTLYPNQTFLFEFDPVEFRTSEGVEDNAIYVESTVNISVMLSNAGDGAIMDTALALPRNNGSNRYMVLSYASSVDEWVCSVGSTVSFYTITAYEDDTTVNIYIRGGSVPVDTVVLQRFQTYTNRTLKEPSAQAQVYEFTGYVIESDKPISLTAGNPCADVDPIKTSGPVWSSMPSIQNAGQTFVSHILEYPNAYLNPYLLRVVSLEDGNNVGFVASGEDVVLNTGQFYDVMIESNVETEYITCDKACMVAQHSIHHDTTAIFMVILPPMQYYVSDVLFTSPDQNGASISSFISIIFATDNPYESRLFLDGTDLSDYLWVVSPLGYSFVEVPVESNSEVAHRLTSEDPEKKFSALVHGQAVIGQGYGYIAGAGQNNSVEEPGPDQNETIPEQDFIYRISMNGNFASSNGVDFGPECTVQYSISMQNQAEMMIPVVNDLIGGELCIGLSSDIVSLQSVSAPLTTDGREGSTFLQYDMLASVGEFGPPEIEPCATEVDQFLMAHSNWDDPLLPIEPGCPGVDFTSSKFNDSGSEWICLDLNKTPLNSDTGASLKRTEVMVGKMLFVITHTGNYYSQDEESIPPDCLASYNSGFMQKTVDQVNDVNTMIMSRDLCTARTMDNIQLSLENVILSGTGSAGLSFQEYEMLYDLGTSSREVYTCSKEVSGYLSQHANWDTPMLPPIGGCPTLVFVPEEFQEYQFGWQCVDV